MPTPSQIILAIGLLLVVGSVVGFARERRRLSNVVFFVIGAVLTLLGIILVTDDGAGAQLWVVVVLSAAVLAPSIGYPLLTIFLVVNGVMMVRRERRSLGNLLSLLLGIVLIVLPVGVEVISHFSPDGAVWRIVVSHVIVYIFGVALYIAFFFFVFLVAAIAYRKIPTDVTADYVIVLGSALIGRMVPPLLAARLDKGIEVANAQRPPATLIPSGGKGIDEEIAEAEGMSVYLEEHGIPQARIIQEDRARTTRENLLLSQKLLPTPETPVLVVTNNYHVFRAALLTRELGVNATVVGAKTARYYVPSAFLREFAAVMKEYLRLNVIVMGAWTLMMVALAVGQLATGS